MGASECPQTLADDTWKGDYEQQHSMNQDDFLPNQQQLPFCGEAKT